MSPTTLEVRTFSFKVIFFLSLREIISKAQGLLVQQYAPKEPVDPGKKLTGKIQLTSKAITKKVNLLTIHLNVLN